MPSQPITSTPPPSKIRQAPVSLPPDTATDLSTDPNLDIDWATVGLGLVATLAVGGLIPFWIFVYFRLFPPIP
jgi:serine/threonine-protein kinase